MASRRGDYIYGSAVRQPVVQPKRERQVQPRAPKKSSRQVQKNRRNAQYINATYVAFMALAAVMALFVCVNYLQLQSEISARSENVASLQEQLETLKDANDTQYDAIMDTVNLETIKGRAAELGMTNATQEQTVAYDDPGTDYVKQYEEIPESGTLAKDVSE